MDFSNHKELGTFYKNVMGGTETRLIENISGAGSDLFGGEM